MAQPPVKIPLGIQSFQKMITGNYTYIDKTQYLYNLILKGEYYFLSGPSGCGKSLLVATLKELFLGNKDLFTSLAISNTGYDREKHAVILLDFSELRPSFAPDLEREIEALLVSTAHRYGITIDDAPSLCEKLYALILRLSKTYNVVVLVDEADGPLYSKPEDEEPYFDLLQDFFETLNDCGEHTSFRFITATNQFEEFPSHFNSADNISFHWVGDQLLGYTIQELIDHYHPNVIEMWQNHFDFEKEIDFYRWRDPEEAYVEESLETDTKRHLYNLHTVLGILKSHEPRHSEITL